MILEREREHMLAEIEADVEMTRTMIGRDRLDTKVMDAMQRVHREDFVPENMRHASYHDRALPIACGQTISQPFIVALMTDLLELDRDSIVLEIGTGSGYQAAILSLLARKVYSVERIPELAQSAARTLAELGYDNVEVRCSDGYLGWPEQAPFDAIIVTAAAAEVPPALLEQLKPGGRMAIPVGMPGMHQDLLLLTRDARGDIETRKILGVAFVPMVEGLEA